MIESNVAEINMLNSQTRLNHCCEFFVTLLVKSINGFNDFLLSQSRGLRDASDCSFSELSQPDRLLPWRVQLRKLSFQKLSCVHRDVPRLYNLFSDYICRRHKN